MAYGLQTYDDKARREDLLDVISDVSPDDNPLTTLLAKRTAKQTTHEWLEDYVARPTSNTGTSEGAAATYSDLTQPSRRTNVTQIISQTYRVSGTERSVSVAGMGDPFVYQQNKALRQWKNRLEFALIRSSLSSGASGSAQTMAGIEATVTSHFTARLSGTSLSEAELNAMVLDVANDVAADEVFDTVLTTLQLRQKISTFTAGSTRYLSAADKRLVRPVMVYESKIAKIGLVKLSYLLENLKALNTCMIRVTMKVNGQFIQLQFQGCNNRQSAGKTLFVDGGDTGWRREFLCEQTPYSNIGNYQTTCDTCGSQRSQFTQRHNCAMRQDHTTHGDRTNFTYKRSKGNSQTVLCASDSRKQEIRTVLTQNNSLCDYQKSTSANSLRVCEKQSRGGTKVLSQRFIYSEGNRIGRYASKIKRIKNPQRLYAKLVQLRDDIVQTLKNTAKAGVDLLDFGVHKIFGHKDVSVSAATPGPRILGLRENKWAIAHLRRPVAEKLAKDGDRDNGQIVGEATLEFLAERANAQRTGYAYTG